MLLMTFLVLASVFSYMMMIGSAALTEEARAKNNRSGMIRHFTVMIIFSVVFVYDLYLMFHN